MVKYGWITDDNAEEMIPIFLEFEFNKDNPGVYINVPELYVDHMVDDGDRKVANAKIHAHAQRQELYNDYMELLTITLDKQNVRRKLLR